MKPNKLLHPASVMLLIFASSANANENLPQAKPDKPVENAACVAPEYRQFDFWLGEWDVYGGTDGKRVLGHSRIELHASGCWLSEHWQSGSGPAHDGTSLNTWDAQYKVWRQFWVGADAGVLRLEGKFHEGVMTLEGQLPGENQQTQLQRITWIPNADGSVTQHWEISDDKGGSWQTSFLGIYRRVMK
ncbi:MAG TPA: hypothetical protein PLF92_08820 [Arenimonas sp.]|nr:hypothetical protein [Arenimonas sp.]HPW32998.1 hypothetical protein [Arenimonas sp.]